MLTLGAWVCSAWSEEVGSGGNLAQPTAAGDDEGADGVVNLRRPSPIPSAQRKKATSRCSSIYSASSLATAIRGGDLG